MKYLDLPILEIHNLLKTKEIRPIDLVSDAIKRIEDDSLNCFITLNKEEAIKQAIELEDKVIDNILFGIPIAIKDNIITKNLRTTCGSKMLEDFNPIYDATVIEKIKSKNMIIIGKTNMDEFGMGSTSKTSYFGSISNPVNKDYVPGGSSGGSAVSLSYVPLSLGSDTGGSIRQPASFCGVVGIKPTYGRVSRHGLVAYAPSLDHIGSISKRVFDNALLLNIISGQDDNDLTSSFEEVMDYTRLIGEDLKGLKIAIPNYFMSDLVDKEVKDKIKEIEKLLKKNNVSIDYIDIPYLENANTLYKIISMCEASSSLARFDGIKYGFSSGDFSSIDKLYKSTRSQGFGTEVKRRIMIGTYLLSDENKEKYYYKALKIRRALTNNFIEVFKKYDLIIGPTTPSVAYKVGENKRSNIFVTSANLTGLPALSLPIGVNEKGLPIGLQIIGNYFKEDVIYQLASFIEESVKK